MTEITRRTFLKAIAASGLLAAIPFDLSNIPLVSFANGEEYGNACHIKHMNQATIKRVLDYILIPDARKVIGHGTIELRGKVGGVERDGAVAWYTNGRIINSKPDHITKPVVIPEGGYIYFGRYCI